MANVKRLSKFSKSIRPLQKIESGKFIFEISCFYPIMLLQWMRDADLITCNVFGEPSDLTNAFLSGVISELRNKNDVQLSRRSPDSEYEYIYGTHGLSGRSTKGVTLQDKCMGYDGKGPLNE